MRIFYMLEYDRWSKQSDIPTETFELSLEFFTKRRHAFSPVGFRSVFPVAELQSTHYGPISRA
jgi:hypothetical protein